MAIKGLSEGLIKAGGLHVSSVIAGSKIAGSKIAGSKIAGSKIAGSKIAVRYRRVIPLRPSTLLTQ